MPYRTFRHAPGHDRALLKERPFPGTERAPRQARKSFRPAEYAHSGALRPEYERRRSKKLEQRDPRTDAIYAGLFENTAGEIKLLNYKHLRNTRKLENVPDSVVKFARECYYAKVEWADRQVGAVIDEIKNSHLADNTVIIYNKSKQIYFSAFILLIIFYNLCHSFKCNIQQCRIQIIFFC